MEETLSLQEWLRYRIDMDDEELRRRKALTFEQAEGLEELPSQLAPRTISADMRVRLWDVVYRSLTATRRSIQYTTRFRIGGPWLGILRNWHLEGLHRFADDFDDSLDLWVRTLRVLFEKGSYHQVLGFLQYVLRQDYPPAGLSAELQSALTASRSAYRVIDDDTIAPFASEAEASTIETALKHLEGTTFKGPRVHLKDAASALSDGDWAASVRESIHAVEAVVRLIGKSNSVDDALKKLANNGHINRNMSAGLVRLYAYTSDEKGIRHPLLEDGDANVDEADALYMLGASASFITYLIGKGRASGLLEA